MSTQPATKPMDDFPLARNLRAALAERGWTQERLAREIDMSNRAVSGWCLGECLPHRRHLKAAALALGHEPAWFYVEHDEPAAAA